MTFRIPSIVLLAIVFLITSSAISFGVAFAVNEWRQSDYIDCVATVQNAYIDKGSEHRSQRPLHGATEDYDVYIKRFDAWADRGDDISKQWGVDTKACH